MTDAPEVTDDTNLAGSLTEVALDNLTIASTGS